MNWLTGGPVTHTHSTSLVFNVSLLITVGILIIETHVSLSSVQLAERLEEEKVTCKMAGVTLTGMSLLAMNVTGL